MPSGFLGGIRRSACHDFSAAVAAANDLRSIELRGSLIPREWRPILRKLYSTSRRF